MGIREDRLLEECVLRILEHGDMNCMTESKVRKLAAEETGIDLSLSENRQLVRRVVQDFFLKDSKQTATSSKISGNSDNPLPNSGRKVNGKEQENEEELEAVEIVAPQKILAVNDGKRKFEMKKQQPLKGLEEEKKFVGKRNPALESPTPMKKKRQLLILDDDDEENGCHEEKKIAQSVHQKSCSKLDSNQKVNSKGEVEEAQEKNEPSIPRAVKDIGQNANKQRKSQMISEKQNKGFANLKGGMHTVQKPIAKGLLNEEEDTEGEGNIDEEEKTATSEKPTVLPIKEKQWDSESDEMDEEQDLKNQKSRKIANGSPFVCKLSETRNVSVEEFKGNTLIAIREYYNKDGKWLPSKKGISLTVEQWSALRKGIPDIEAALKRRKQ